MPSIPLQITINTKTYNVEILTGEMSNLAQEMETTKEEIRRLAERRKNALGRLEENSNQMLILYIQQTGSFPPDTNNNIVDRDRDSDNESKE
jgi:hypothetical protein